MNTKSINGIEFTASCWPPDNTKPVVLLIHGATLSKTFWDAQMLGLETISTTIALDLPGHGGSQGEALDNVPAYAKCVADYITSAGIGDYDIIICGLSMGGAIAQQLLISYPDLFKAGILINTGARLKVHPMIIESIRADYSQFIRAMPRTMVAPNSDPTLFEQKIYDSIGNNTAETSLKGFHACNQFDVMADVGKIACPVLVLSAEHDTSTPVKFGDWLARNIPNATYTCVKDAGHLSPLEKPEEINKEICQFLKNLN